MKRVAAALRSEPDVVRSAMGSDPDFELLARWRDGDRKAGDALVAKHFDAVRKFFVNAVSDEDRNDLTNETFHRLMRAMQGFEGRSTVRTFIFRLAHNALYDHLRGTYRRDKLGFDPLTHSVEDVEAATPSRVVAELERYQQLIALLRALPVETKQMMELYHWQGCSAEELAEVYGIEPTTVRTRMHAARRRIQKALNETAGRTPANAELEAVEDGDEDELTRDLRAVGVLLTRGPSKL